MDNTVSSTQTAGDNLAVANWLNSFGAALSTGDIEAVTALFDETCYWRDFVAFTWNIKTVQGRPEIAALLAATLAPTAPTNWAVDGEAWVAGEYVEAWLTFQTAVGDGRGHLRLVDGKCRTLLTTLESLTGFEEKSG